MKAALLALIAFLLAAPAFAVECRNDTFEGLSFTRCDVDATREDLRLFHSANGEVLGGFSKVEQVAGPLAFAMNAGMYHPDRSPVGLFKEGGTVISDIVTSDGPGNFGLLPNGVFCISEGRARVIESLSYVADDPACRDATQSGPMLVIDGALHPKLIPDGSSRFIRNGVGTSADGTRASFVISNDPVNFHTFARYFRDRVNVPDALYFDGRVSRLYAPALGRDDVGFQLGPIVGVVSP